MTKLLISILAGAFFISSIALAGEQDQIFWSTELPGNISSIDPYHSGDTCSTSNRPLLLVQTSSAFISRYDEFAYYSLSDGKIEDYCPKNYQRRYLEGDFTRGFLMFKDTDYPDTRTLTKLGKKSSCPNTICEEGSNRVLSGLKLGLKNLYPIGKVDLVQFFENGFVVVAGPHVCQVTQPPEWDPDTGSEPEESEMYRARCYHPSAKEDSFGKLIKLNTQDSRLLDKELIRVLQD
ncbi:MAG: hypothetical protein AB7H97_19075 [Pseudobdellovibrionaceae bacterium]